MTIVANDSSGRIVVAAAGRKTVVAVAAEERDLIRVDFVIVDVAAGIEIRQLVADAARRMAHGVEADWRRR